jgi:hypothetical protein
MKKTKFILAVLFLFVVILFSGCATTIPQNLIVDPDPDNPYQGTWIATYSDRTILVIENMNVTMYIRQGDLGAEWKKIYVYSCEEREDVFYIEQQPLILNNNILTLNHQEYERYFKK